MWSIWKTENINYEHIKKQKIERIQVYFQA